MRREPKVKEVMNQQISEAFNGQPVRSRPRTALVGIGSLLLILAGTLTGAGASAPRTALAAPALPRAAQRLGSGLRLTAPAVPRRLRMAVDATLGTPASAAPVAYAQSAKLTNSDGWTKFGFSVALSTDGSTALIGAPGFNAITNNTTGAAYIFTKSNGVWSQTAELTDRNLDLGQGSGFGSAVALSGDGTIALMGAPGQNSGTSAAYVFGLTPKNEITANDGHASDSFGYSVALSSNGTTALIGAPGKSAAYVFSDTDGTWTQTTTLTASGSGSFGSSVALSADGTTALIGADATNFAVGAAYVFTQSGSSWSQTTELTASDGQINDYFGDAVARSSDGATALVGADAGGVYAGTAYVFTQSGGTWSQAAELTASNG